VLPVLDAGLSDSPILADQFVKRAVQLPRVISAIPAAAGRDRQLQAALKVA
jgi:hypothetical protein